MEFSLRREKIISLCMMIVTAFLIFWFIGGFSVSFSLKDHTYRLQGYTELDVYSHIYSPCSEMIVKDVDGNNVRLKTSDLILNDTVQLSKREIDAAVNNTSIEQKQVCIVRYQPWHELDLQESDLLDTTRFVEVTEQAKEELRNKGYSEARSEDEEISQKSFSWFLHRDTLLLGLIPAIIFAAIFLAPTIVIHRKEGYIELYFICVPLMVLNFYWICGL